MLLLGQGALVMVISAYGASLPSWMVFNTPRHCRYTVIGLGYNLAHATLGGTAPMLSTLLLRWTGSAMSIGAYFGLLCACSGSVLTWYTGLKARRSGVDSTGAGSGGVRGRRGYAQLERASMFDNDDESGSVAAPPMMGQLGNENGACICCPLSTCCSYMYSLLPCAKSLANSFSTCTLHAEIMYGNCHRLHCMHVCIAVHQNEVISTPAWIRRQQRKVMICLRFAVRLCHHVTMSRTRHQWRQILHLSHRVII